MPNLSTVVCFIGIAFCRYAAAQQLAARLRCLISSLNLPDMATETPCSAFFVAAISLIWPQKYLV